MGGTPGTPPDSGTVTDRDSAPAARAPWKRPPTAQRPGCWPGGDARPRARRHPDGPARRQGTRQRPRARGPGSVPTGQGNRTGAPSRRPGGTHRLHSAPAAALVAMPDRAPFSTLTARRDARGRASALRPGSAPTGQGEAQVILPAPWKRAPSAQRPGRRPGGDARPRARRHPDGTARRPRARQRPESDATTQARRRRPPRQPPPAPTPCVLTAAMANIHPRE